MNASTRKSPSKKVHPVCHWNKYDLLYLAAAIALWWALMK